MDYNATAPVRPEARAAALAAIETGGNASAVYAEGRRARAMIEEARAEVAALFEVAPAAVCFTSGGTEAAAMVLARPPAGRITRLVVGATEHAAVINGQGFAAETVAVAPVDGQGRIDGPRLAALLDGAAPALVAVQVANNETGVLQPLAEIAPVVEAAGGVLVADAVQSAGRLPWGVNGERADFAFLSAHKLGGLPGAGALVALRGSFDGIAPLIRGGGQERGLRGGTENLPAIAAFGAAARAVRLAPDGERLRGQREAFEGALLRLVPGAVIFGAQAARLPNTTAFALPGLRAETLLMGLDLAGIAVSSGSACASGKVGRSHVLEAMGVAPDLRAGVIRVSLGWRTEPADIEALIQALAAIVDRVARRSLSAAA